MHISKIVTSLEQQTNAKYKRSKNTPFDTSKTILYDYDDDLSKRWIIIYWIYDSDKGKLVRKQSKISQKLKTVTERNKFAKEKIKSINKVLKAGYYIGSVQIGEVSKITIDAIWEIYKLNSNQYKGRTNDTYKTPLKHFENYLKYAGLSKLKLHDFDKKKALGFRDYLSSVPKTRSGSTLSNRSVNNYWSAVSTFFEYMKTERDWIKVNPFSGIKKLKQLETVTNRAWKADEVKVLMPLLRRPENHKLYLFSQFIYWLWLRPADVVNMKVIDFDLHRFKVLVPASITKNSKTKWITIPTGFRKMLLATGIKHQHKDKYIFSIDKNQKGKKAILFGFEQCGDNLFTKYFAQLRDSVELSEDGTFSKFSKGKKEMNNKNAIRLSREVKLYGLKRNGFCNAAMNGASIYTLKDHARHSTLDETDTYLRNSGINLLEETEINNMKGLDFK